MRIFYTQRHVKASYLGTEYVRFPPLIPCLQYGMNHLN